MALARRDADADIPIDRVQHPTQRYALMERCEGADEPYLAGRRGLHLTPPDEGDVVGTRLIAGLHERESPAFRKTRAAIGAEIALVRVAKRLIRAREMLRAQIEHMFVVWREERKHFSQPSGDDGRWRAVRQSLTRSERAGV